MLDMFDRDLILLCGREFTIHTDTVTQNQP